jgi:predicted PurR-regulated permease PerM
VSKYWQIGFVIAALVALLWLAYVLRTIIFPFLLGITLAYAVLLPPIHWLEKRLPRRMRANASARISAIALVYILMIVVLGSFSFFAISAVIRSLNTLALGSVDIFAAASENLKQWTEPIRSLFPDDLKLQMDTYINDMTGTVFSALREALGHLVTTLPSNMGIILSLATIPYFLFYVLKDHEKLRDGVYTGLPVWASTPTRRVFSILEDAVGRYVRASLTLGLIVGVLNLVGLLIIGAPQAPVLALVTGLTEMIPVIGGWAGGIVVVLVTLALAPDKVVWVAVVVIAVQLLENLIFVPRVQAAYFRIHPALAVLILVAATYLGGIWGVVLAMPLTAAIVGFYKYWREATNPPAESSEDVPESHAE